MLIRQIVDDKLAQHAFLIGCQRTGEALIVDPERDVDRYLTLAEREGLRLVAAAETHIHADFLSGSRELVARGARPARLSLGRRWRWLALRVAAAGRRTGDLAARRDDVRDRQRRGARLAHAWPHAGAHVVRHHRSRGRRRRPDGRADR